VSLDTSPICVFVRTVWKLLKSKLEPVVRVGKVRRMRVSLPE